MNGPQSHGDTEINRLTHQIIGCAIEVHRVIGPGLLEPAYETAMCIEFEDAGFSMFAKRACPRSTKGAVLVSIGSI